MTTVDDEPEATERVEATGQAEARSSRRAALVPWARRLLVALVLAGAGYQLVTQWHSVSATLLALPWHLLVLSELAVLAGIWLSTLVWQTVLADLGTPVGVAAGARVFLVGQLGKYVPGSLWAFLLQMELGKAIGASRWRIFTASLVAAGLGVVASLVTGLFAVPVVLHGHREVLWLFLLLPAGLGMLHPRPLTWLVSRVLRLLRRPPLPRPLRAAPIARAALYAVAVYAVFGAHLWLLADALAAPGFPGLVLCAGAIGLGMTAGLFAFLLPSGIGVRDAVVVAALATLLPYGQAFALAVVSRLMFTVAELASAGAATVFAQLRRPHTAD